jgi:hypothetical protein
MLQMRNVRKVPKHLFRPGFSMIELVESTNRAFVEVFILGPTIWNAIILACIDFFHLQTQRIDYMFCLINGLRDCVALG